MADIKVMIVAVLSRLIALLNWKLHHFNVNVVQLLVFRISLLPAVLDSSYYLVESRLEKLTPACSSDSRWKHCMEGLC